MTVGKVAGPNPRGLQIREGKSHDPQEYLKSPALRSTTTGMISAHHLKIRALPPQSGIGTTSKGTNLCGPINLVWSHAARKSLSDPRDIGTLAKKSQSRLILLDSKLVTLCEFH